MRSPDLPWRQKLTERDINDLKPYEPELAWSKPDTSLTS